MPDKTDLLLTASRIRGLKVFSSMGAALRFDPTKVTTGELMIVHSHHSSSATSFPPET